MGKGKNKTPHGRDQAPPPAPSSPILSDYVAGRLKTGWLTLLVMAVGILAVVVAVASSRGG